MKTLTKLLLALGCTATLSARATTVFYDFNDQNNLGWSGITTDNNDANWSSSNGLDGTGAVGRQSDVNRTAATVTTQQFDGSVGQLSFGTFVFFDLGGQETQADTRFALGFKDNQLVGQTRNDPERRIGNADNSVYAALDFDGSTGIRIGLGVSGDGTGTYVSSDFETVSNSSWYYLSSDYEHLGTDGNWRLTASLFALDTNGDVDFSSSVISFTNDFTGGPLLSAFSEVYGSVDHAPSGGRNRRAVQWIDDATITVIPEPGTLALIGIAAIAGLIGFRRRRS